MSAFVTEHLCRIRFTADQKRQLASEPLNAISALVAARDTPAEQGAITNLTALLRTELEAMFKAAATLSPPAIDNDFQTMLQAGAQTVSLNKVLDQPERHAKAIPVLGAVANVPDINDEAARENWLSRAILIYDLLLLTDRRTFTAHQ